MREMKTILTSEIQVYKEGLAMHEMRCKKQQVDREKSTGVAQ